MMDRDRDRDSRRKEEEFPGVPTRRGAKLLDGVTDIDYKDQELLRKFMTERGKIMPRRVSGTTSKQQRQIKQAIRRARVLGLVP
jgi:small subunit ribosomal protein S18